MMRFSRILILIVLITNFACEVKKAEVSTENQVTTVELKSFPAENIRLVNNKFFLWKNQMSSTDVKNVSELAREIDRLDDEVFPLGKTFKEVSQRYDVDSEQSKIEIQSLRKKNNDYRNQYKCAKCLRPDPRLCPTCTKDEAEMARLTSLMAQVDTEIVQIEKRLEQLATEKSSVNTRMQEYLTRGQKAVSDIMKLVDWYSNQPKSISFVHDSSGKIKAEISEWDLNDGQGMRTFSSDSEVTPLNLLEDVKYQERGGIYTLKAVVYQLASVSFSSSPKKVAIETYCFKFARAKYDSTAKDGRIFYAGEMYVEPATSSCDFELLKKSPSMRKGVVKLVDRNN